MEIGQRILIVGNGLKGQIVGEWKDLTGTIQYNVRYFNADGDAKLTWFYPSEIADLP